MILINYSNFSHQYHFATAFTKRSELSCVKKPFIPSLDSINATRVANGKIPWSAVMDDDASMLSTAPNSTLEPRTALSQEQLEADQEPATEEEQGETSPGDTHDNVDQEDVTSPLPFEAVSQETVCH